VEVHDFFSSIKATNKLLNQHFYTNSTHPLASMSIYIQPTLQPSIQLSIKSLIQLQFPSSIELLNESSMHPTFQPSAAYDD